MASDFKYEIVQHICVLSDKNNGWRRECNVVRWNDGTPKFDIRDWSYDRSSMSKGVTLTKNELLQLQKNIRFVRIHLLDVAGTESAENNVQVTAASEPEDYEKNAPPQSVLDDEEYIVLATSGQ